MNQIKAVRTDLDENAVWARVKRFAEDRLADGKPVFTNERGVKNYVTDVKPKSIGRWSEEGSTNASRVTASDVAKLWEELNGGPKADVLYITRALMDAAVPDLVEVVDGQFRLRDQNSRQPAAHDATPAESTLRVALIVSEVDSEVTTCSGRFPKEAIERLISLGSIDLVVFPEMFRSCKTRNEVVLTARCLAEDLGVSVLTGVWCDEEEMQCAGYWNPRPAAGETREHFYAKHATSVRLAYELGDYETIREAMFTPIRLRGRKLGVLLCHDMFFGLVGARWIREGADALLDLTGSNVNLAKWNNVICGRSIEHGVPFLCTMGHQRFKNSGSACAIGYRAGRAMCPLHLETTESDGSVTLFDLEGEAQSTEASEQAYSGQQYQDLRIALGARAAQAHCHVELDGTSSGEPVPGTTGWRGFNVGNARVGLLVLPLSRLADALAIHTAEPKESPFDHHVVVFASADGEIDHASAISLARLRAIEHRMAVGILTPTIREMLKTTRYKNIQRFRHRDGVFGLDTEFLGGTYAYAPTTGFDGIRREFLDAYRSLMESAEASRSRRWAHGDIVIAKYPLDGQVYDPVRVIRPNGWGCVYVHWEDDDTFSTIPTSNILGRSSKPWTLELVPEDWEPLRGTGIGSHESARALDPAGVGYQ